MQLKTLTLSRTTFFRGTPDLVQKRVRKRMQRVEGQVKLEWRKNARHMHDAPHESVLNEHDVGAVRFVLGRPSTTKNVMGLRVRKTADMLECQEYVRGPFWFNKPFRHL